MLSLKEVWSSFKTPRHKKVPDSEFKITNVNPTQDLGWLFDLTKLYVSNEKFIFELKSKKVFTDEDLVTTATEVTVKIISTLSDKYMNILKSYIKEDQITAFIGEIVVKNMIEFGLSKNKNVFSLNKEASDEPTEVES